MKGERGYKSSSYKLFLSECFIVMKKLIFMLSQNKEIIFQILQLECKHHKGKGILILLVYRYNHSSKNSAWYREDAQKIFVEWTTKFWSIFHSWNFPLGITVSVRKIYLNMCGILWYDHVHRHRLCF